MSKSRKIVRWVSIGLCMLPSNAELVDNNGNRVPDFLEGTAPRPAQDTYFAKFEALAAPEGGSGPSIYTHGDDYSQLFASSGGGQAGPGVLVASASSALGGYCNTAAVLLTGLGALDPAKAGVMGRLVYQTSSSGTPFCGCSDDELGSTIGTTPSHSGAIDILAGPQYATLSIRAATQGAADATVTTTYETVVFEDRRHWAQNSGGTMQRGNANQWHQKSEPLDRQYAVFNNTEPRTLPISLDADRSWRGLIVDGETINLDLGGHLLDLTAESLSVKEYNLLLGEGRGRPSRLTVRNGRIDASKSIFVGGDNLAEFIVDSGVEAATAAGLVVTLNPESQGVVTIRNSGKLTARRLDVANLRESSGTVIVKDPGSALIIEGAGSSIGKDGHGEVLVQGGASATWGAVLTDIGSKRKHSAVLRVEGPGTTSNEGSFGIGNGALLEVRDRAALHSPAGLINVAPGGTFRLEDSTAHLLQLNVAGGTAIIEGGAVATVAQAGLSGGLMRITGAGTRLTGVENLLVNGGTFELSNGATAEGGSVFIRRGARVGGATGTLKFDNVLCDGLLAPGSSPGALTIEGDFELGPDGFLELQIGGMTPGTDYDQLIVTGNATLNGRVILSFSNGFAPAAGQSFDFISAGNTLSGSAIFEVEGLAPGWEFETSLDTETGTLTVTSLSAGVSTIAEAFPEPLSTGEDTLIRARNGSGKIHVSELLANDTGLYSRPLEVISVASSIEGGNVALDGNWVIYQAPSDLSGVDSFDYTIIDDRGHTATGVAHVLLSPSSLEPSKNILDITVDGSEVRLRAIGIPGRRYWYEVTSSLVAPISWDPFGYEQVADSNGRIEFLDYDPPATRFYRVVEYPY